jgi:hypothetical protein
MGHEVWIVWLVDREYWLRRMKIEGVVMGRYEKTARRCLKGKKSRLCIEK